MKRVTGSVWLKLLALLVAGLVWLYVATDREYRVVRTFLVSRLLLHDGLVLSSASPDSIKVMIAATGKELLLLQSEAVSLQINAVGYDAGKQVVSLGVEQLVLIGTVTDARVVRVIAPEFVEMTLDNVAHRLLPIRALFDPLTDDQFIVGGEVGVLPANVLAHGPRQLLDSLTELVTDSIPLRGLRNDVTLTVGVRTPDERIYQLEPDSVRVHLSILPAQTVTIDSIPIKLVRLPAALMGRVDPAYLTIDIIGASAVTSLPTRDNIRATVNGDDLDSTGHGAVEVETPDGWLIAKLSSPSVMVSLIRRDKS